MQAERYEISPAFTTIRRSVRSDGFKRLEAQRVLPPILAQRMPPLLHADHIGTPRLVIRDRDGWVVIGYRAGVLHRIPDPASQVPTGTVFYQPQHRIAYRLGVIDEPIELPKGELLYSNNSDRMVLVSHRTGQVVPVIYISVPVGSADWSEDDDDTARVQPQVPFAVFSIPNQPTLGDILGTLSSFHELVPLVRGTSLYRYGDGFIVRTPLVVSYVDYPMDILYLNPLADAVDEMENTPNVVEIPVTGELDIDGIGSGDWMMYPSCERRHELHISDMGTCLSPVKQDDPQYRPNAYLYRPGVYTFGRADVNVQDLMSLLWRYVGAGNGSLVSLIDHHHSSYYRTPTHSWMLCPVYVAAIIRSEHGMRLVAPVPPPYTDLVHLWTGHEHRH